MSARVDEKFYQAIRHKGLAERMLIAARDRIYADFLSEMKPNPSTTIVDVGVSDVVNPGANLLERLYPYQDRITACGLGDACEFQSAFPKVAYHRIEPNSALPFADDTFDIATANAVLEHVGSHDNQRAFVKELCRVARKVFVTVPHRYFPVEHHTAVPLLHWTDSTFKVSSRLLGKGEWALMENLILMSAARLADAMPAGRRFKIGKTGLPLGPFSSNLYAAID